MLETGRIENARWGWTSLQPIAAVAATAATVVSAVAWDEEVVVVVEEEDDAAESVVAPLVGCWYSALPPVRAWSWMM